MTANNEPKRAMAMPKLHKPERESSEKIPQMTGIITPVALIGARIDIVPIARLRYNKNMAAIPMILAGMAQRSSGSLGKGEFNDKRIMPRRKVPVREEIIKIPSVGRLRLLRPPMKSAIPQPKQANMDNVIGNNYGSSWLFVFNNSLTCFNCRLKL
ncbi:MAG: hypothetical protein KAH62_07725 [Desulfobacula sp.]|nr:hypothetical protein [Desulfobacula sp.]